MTRRTPAREVPDRAPRPISGKDTVRVDLYAPCPSLPAQVTAVTRLAARYSTDDTDAVILLRCLGLIPDPDTKPQTSRC